jgi:hypothetical protein
MDHHHRKISLVVRAALIATLIAASVIVELTIARWGNS